MTPAQDRVEEAVSVLERMERIKTQYPDANWGKETEAALVILAELRRLRTQAEGLKRAARQMRCGRCSMQMDYPHLDPEKPCFACSGLKAALRGE